MGTEERYERLIEQLDRMRRHIRQGGERTRARYYESMKRLCRYLADNWEIQHLTDLSPEHIEGYVAKLQAQGKSPATIKSDLSGLRFYHDQMMEPTHRHLPSNGELALARRSYRGIDRTWTETEFLKMAALMEQDGRRDFATMLHLSRYTGMRIHECCSIDTAMASAALRNGGTLVITGKGQQKRQIQLSPYLQDRLRGQLEQVRRGQKLFVPPGDDDIAVIHRVEAYIWLKRELVQEDETREITFHGLRHTYAAETYKSLLGEGLSSEDAEQIVAQRLGHRHRKMARLYLASVQS